MDPLCVNVEPPDGLPNIRGVCGCILAVCGWAGGDLLNKLFVFENRFAGAEPIRLNSDGPFGPTGVTELAGWIGLPFNC